LEFSTCSLPLSLPLSSPSQVDLVASTSTTLPFETLHQVRTLALDPAGRTLVAIDGTGRALVIALAARALLGHVSFGGTVPAASFSPDGAFLAVAVGRLVQVWRAPPRAKTVAPLALHRTYGQASGAITCLAWAPDGLWLAAGSKDLTVRVWSLDPVPEGVAGSGSAPFKPPVLAGHKDDPVAVFWSGMALDGGREAGKAAAAAAAAAALGADPAAAAPVLYSLSRDGACFAWTFTPEEGGEAAPSAGLPGWEEEGEGNGAGAGAPTPTPPSPRPWAFSRGKWRLAAKHFFNQRGARVTCAAHHAGAGLIVAGMSSGAFDLRELPSFAPIHALSASKGPLSSLAFNGRGDWLAMGAAKHGQLCAWEWRAEAYVLRQQGHAYAAAAAAFSPDGGLLATGADDAKVKLWGVASGFCHVTLGGGTVVAPAGGDGGAPPSSSRAPGHTAPITGLAFLPSSGALLSSSRDGTVRAWDLARYRCFRTLVPPERAQLGCVAADAGSGGDIVAAGGADTCSIYVWSVRTSRVLDVLAGHEGPVSCLAFSPAAGGAGSAGGGAGPEGQGRAVGAPLLASGSWDKTVRLWDVFGGKGAVEALPHAHEVLSLAWHPAGHTLAASTLDGGISLWDPAGAVLRGSIEGRRDVLAGAGAGASGDLRSAANAAASAAFTSLAYSADGAFLVGGGAGTAVCIYDAEERVLLRRLVTTTNRSLGGVRSAAGAHHSSGRPTDAGPGDTLPDGGSDDEDGLLPASVPGGGAGASGLPGTGGGVGAAGGGGKPAPPVPATRAVALCPLGRHLAAATTEGVLLFVDDPGTRFDPGDLGEDVTPARARAALAGGNPVLAARLALRLGDAPLLEAALLGTPPSDVGAAARALPPECAPGVLAALAALLPRVPHAEHGLAWARALLTVHARALRAAPRAATAPALRAISAAAAAMQADLAVGAASNVHTLEYLSTAPMEEETSV